MALNGVVSVGRCDLRSPLNHATWHGVTATAAAGIAALPSRCSWRCDGVSSRSARARSPGTTLVSRPVAQVLRPMRLNADVRRERELARGSAAHRVDRRGCPVCTDATYFSPRVPAVAPSDRRIGGCEMKVSPDRLRPVYAGEFSARSARGLHSTLAVERVAGRNSWHVPGGGPSGG